MKLKTLGILTVSTLLGITLVPLTQAQDNTRGFDRQVHPVRGQNAGPLRGRAAAPATRRHNGPQRDPARLIERADVNADGLVSTDEFVDHSLLRVDELFVRLDADGNGLISLDESTRPERPERPERRDRPERPEIDREALRECVRETIADYEPELQRGLADIFQEVDTNGDGQLSLSEVSIALEERAHALFARFDTDGDGFISETEVAEHYANELNLRRVIRDCIEEQLAAGA